MLIAALDLYLQWWHRPFLIQGVFFNWGKVITLLGKLLTYRGHFWFMASGNKIKILAWVRPPPSLHCKYSKSAHSCYCSLFCNTFVKLVRRLGFCTCPPLPFPKFSCPTCGFGLQLRAMIWGLFQGMLNEHDRLYSLYFIWRNIRLL